MSIEHVEVIVEEPSMEAALRILLPRLLGRLSFEVYSHQCKNEMLAQLPNRLRGYQTWLPEDWRIVVVVDRDDDDCRDIKDRLEQMASDVDLITRRAAGGQSYVLVTRLAIEELEAWYFGDWRAVRSAYPKVSETIPRKAAYRDTDSIRGGTWEAFERVLKKAGYFRSGLRKIEAARTIAAHWDPDRNTSKSFQVLRDTLREIAAL
ncbi:MAG: DUF4276 family protein [Planctomycetia bacterium]|nr:DUF4276 family protein [Planctomycetia bacterium]